MASKTKIYIVLEFVTGGELFDKIVRPLLRQCVFDCFQWKSCSVLCARVLNFVLFIGSRLVKGD